MEIRLATSDDVDALAALRPAVHDKHVRAHPEYFKPLTPDGARREAEALLAREGAHVLIGSVSGIPVGFLAAILAERPERNSAYARRIIFVDTIAVNESERGRGYGKQLLDAAVALARELGVGRVELEVWDFNEQARGFFAAQDFVPMYARLARQVK